MITIKNIYKSFGNQEVLHDFTYQFQDTGFYLLFGPSGCGKTTLLNIIAGIWKSDQGEVFYDQASIEELGQSLDRRISYITQDAYFVDYLNVHDNLKLCEVDEGKIKDILHRFQLSHVLMQYPITLSGGERQRLAIARSLLLQRDILLLDEPTSALDRENRDIILSILEHLKKDYLIICVSHDPQMKMYCDEFIDFMDLQKNQEQIQPLNVKVKKEQLDPSVSFSLYPYIKKQFRYYKINKWVATFIIILLSSVFLLSSLFLDMESKILSSLGNDHHVNAMKVHCALDQSDACANWEGKDNVLASVYDYAEGALYFEPIEEKIGESVTLDIPYQESLVSLTLPTDESLFHLQEELVHGTYLMEQMDVLLGAELAQKIANEYASEKQELIGKQIEIETPHGTEHFTVRGIFKPFTQEQDTYLRVLGKDARTANRSYYFSEQYANSYIKDGQLSEIEKGTSPVSVYTFYFSSFEDALAFQEIYADQTQLIQPQTYHKLFGSIINEFNSYSAILMPLLILFLMLMIIFHLFIQNVQMKYEKHILAVYQYCGYSIRRIKKATILYYIVEMNILYVISFVLSMLLGISINVLNDIYHFSSFPLFRISIASMILIYFCILLFGTLLIQYQFQRMKSIGWYNLLRSRRDFL